MFYRDPDDNYIKFYYKLDDLFEKTKKESSLQAKMLGSVEGVGDVFDFVAITNDERIQFDESLDIVFYPIGDLFKVLGLDYVSFNNGSYSMVQQEVMSIDGVDTDVYSIYSIDRGAVHDATIAMLDQKIEKYITYALVNSIEKFMNKNQYLDLSDRMLGIIAPMNNLIYQCTMEQPIDRDYIAPFVVDDEDYYVVDEDEIFVVEDSSKFDNL